MMRTLTIALLCAILVAGCSTGRLDGANLLQSRTVPFDHPDTATALRHLRALGANTVAIIVFLEQDAPDSTAIRVSPAVTDAQLRAAIRTARRQRLQVFVKPQFLVRDSWAGEVDPGDDARWREWFDAYQAHLLKYARLAAAESAQGFVVGTELRRAAQRPEWADLIAAVRRDFPGTLSYAAHGLDGFQAYAHWHLLDLAGVTLYPALGPEPTRDAMRAHIDDSVRQLQQAAEHIDTPLWITEIGIQSRAGAQLQPWEWRHVDHHAAPDPELQADVVDLWLDALAGDWNRGTLVWAWSNDPHAGGPADRDYLLQNKPAEDVLRCHWLRRCP